MADWRELAQISTIIVLELEIEFGTAHPLLKEDVVVDDGLDGLVETHVA